MKRLFSFIILFAALASCESSNEIPAAFLGTWQSDENLTVESMRSSNMVPPDVRDVFEDEFFGKLIVVFREKEGKTYFIDSEEAAEFEPHNIVASGDNFVTFSSPENEDLGLPIERTWYVDGNILAVRIDEWGFVEYFRRIEE